MKQVLVPTIVREDSKPTAQNPVLLLEFQGAFFSL
jgi:hypothetical protein